MAYRVLRHNQTRILGGIDLPPQYRPGVNFDCDTPPHQKCSQNYKLKKR